MFIGSPFLSARDVFFFGGWGFVFASPEKGNFCFKGWNLLILVDLLRLSHVRFASKT